MDISEFELIGHFGVDSGLCWIGDPCYIIHSSQIHKSLGQNWQDFCSQSLGRCLETVTKTFKHETISIPILTSKVDKNGFVSLNYDAGHEGLGICIRTNGDGLFPVYMKRKNDRVCQILIDFDGEI